jgi:hypothetical protein
MPAAACATNAQHFETSAAASHAPDGHAIGAVPPRSSSRCSQRAVSGVPQTAAPHSGKSAQMSLRAGHAALLASRLLNFLARLELTNLDVVPCVATRPLTSFDVACVDLAGEQARDFPVGDGAVDVGKRRPPKPRSTKVTRIFQSATSNSSAAPRTCRSARHVRGSEQDRSWAERCRPAHEVWLFMSATAPLVHAEVRGSMRVDAAVSLPGCTSFAAQARDVADSRPAPDSHHPFPSIANLSIQPDVPSLQMESNCTTSSSTQELALV